MAQVRAAWGTLVSQYDALLAANPRPGVPNDRWVMLRRCRGWVVWRGYSHEISADSLSVYGQTAEGSARWAFAVPSGMGRSLKMEIELSLDPAGNDVQLIFRRTPGVLDEDLDPSEPVDLILRPDLEDRSVHAFTRAHLGPETAWPPAVRAEEAGFAFRPAADRTLVLRTSHGRFNPVPRWEYGVEHPMEAERGLESRTDLFSPGFFRIPFPGGEPVRVTASMVFGEGAEASGTDRSEFAHTEPVPPRLSLREALSIALRRYLADRDEGLTLLAGFPWFLDWGRDTLIGVRGFAAAGLLDESARILTTIARHEREGTLPNMIRGTETSNRDTSDAPLWLAVACADHLRESGSETLLDADCGGRTMRDVLASIGAHYRDGTPSGIGVDRESGLVFSPSHFTWMDTNHPAGTPREGYPIEIQALWHAALRFLHRATGQGEWEELASRVGRSIPALYAKEGVGLSDCLHGARGMPAAQAVPDDHLRPNQLLALTLGAVSDRELGRAILAGSQALLVPGAIRSLADRPVRHPLPIPHEGQVLGDPARPYRGRYTGPEETGRKPAYHNGTAWTWLFPSYAEALYLVGGEAAREEALSLLGTTVELVNAGCLGHLPEILDGDAPHAQRGCGAQMWAASEALRVLALLEDGDSLSGE
jgi:glycogen debranching enzyme